MHQNNLLSQVNDLSLNRKKVLSIYLNDVIKAKQQGIHNFFPFQKTYNLIKKKF